MTTNSLLKRCSGAPAVLAGALLLSPAAMPARGQVIALTSPANSTQAVFGFDVQTVPDVDGDGAWDLLIGAPDEWDPGPPPTTGHIYIFSGRSAAFIRRLTSPIPSDRVATAFGSTNGMFGFSDINGDGAGDVIAGARAEANFEGRAYVHSGANAGVIRSLFPPPNGGGGFGGSVGVLPATHEDELPIGLVGAFFAPPNEDGRAHLFDPLSGALVRTTLPPGTGASFGQTVVGLGDVDGDGRSDYAVQDPGERPPGWTAFQTGVVHVFSGATGMHLYAVWGDDQRVRWFGYDMADVGDIDGDGRPDFAVSATRFASSPGGPPGDHGRVFLFSGATGARIRTLISPNVQSSGWFGSDVSALPDCDGDGVGDILVGAYLEHPPSSPLGAGSAHVFSGQTGRHLRTLLSLATGQRPDQPDHFGTTAVGVPDTNGDGKPEILIGAPNEAWTPPEVPYHGRAYYFLSCAADYNFDGRASVQDLFDFLAHWFVPAPNTPPGADFNRDGVTNVGDVFAFLAAWFAGCSE